MIGSCLAVFGSGSGGQTCDKNQLLKEIAPRGVAESLAAEPFLPAESRACYVSAPPYEAMRSLAYRILVLTEGWLHLLEITKNEPGAGERGEPVIRWSIAVNEIVAIRSDWNAYDTFQQIDQALEVSRFHARITLDRALGPYEAEIDLPMAVSDSDGDVGMASTVAQQFVEAILAMKLPNTG